MASPGTSRARLPGPGWVCASPARLSRGRAGSRGQGGRSRLEGSLRGESRWPRAEEAAPPFPEAAPSPPLGSAPGAVGLWGRAARGSLAKPGHLVYPFPILPAWEPRPQTFTWAREEQGGTWARDSWRLGPWALRAAVAAPGSFAFSRAAGWAEGGTRGGGAGRCGAPWSLPRTSLSGFLQSPGSCDLRPPMGLWPGLPRRGPSHPQCRRVPAPPLQASTRNPDEMLKSACGGAGGGESDAVKLRPVVFHVVQSGSGLGPGWV